VTRRRRLVALEGIDGVGKSTLQRAVATRLRRGGWKVALWREPTRASLGRTAQALGPTDPIGAAIHFTLDRLLSRPRLERLLDRSDVVLSDRSFHSTLAYQGSTLSRSGFQRLARLQLAVAHPPDRVLWLDLPVEEALRRVGTGTRPRSARATGDPPTRRLRLPEVRPAPRLGAPRRAPGPSGARGRGRRRPRRMARGPARAVNYPSRLGAPRDPRSDPRR
jgi:thymidylate kinase